MSESLNLVYSIPCQKVIVAANGETSLIGMLETVQIGVSPEAPEKFLAPMAWSLVTLWTRPKDAVAEELQYEQKSVLNDVDGNEIFVSHHSFETPIDYEYFRTQIDFPAMPVAASGPVSVETFLRQKPSKEWKNYFSYLIYVNRIEVDTDANKDEPNDDENNKTDESNDES